MILFGRLVLCMFKSEKEDFAVYRMVVYGGDVAIAVFKGRDGMAPPARKTVRLQLSGDWASHPKYGRQFVFTSCKKDDQKHQKTRPDDLDALLAAKRHAKLRPSL